MLGEGEGCERDMENRGERKGTPRLTGEVMTTLLGLTPGTNRQTAEGPV